MPLITDALILRENNQIGEADRFVVALTRERGLLRASARGARKLKSRNASATQLLSYSRLTLIEGRDKYIITEAEPLHVFFELRSDMEKLSLAQYFCEIAGVLVPWEEPAEESLRLLLNALHFLGAGTRPAPQVKAVTELRLLQKAGYSPDLAACRRCGGPAVEGAFLLPVRGTLRCARCGAEPGAVPVSPAVLAALRYVLRAPFEKCFQFALPETELRALAHTAETFLLAQLNRGFRTLEFYHTLVAPTGENA